MYYDSSGPENTKQTLKIAFETARQRGIHTVLVASTTGTTAKQVPHYIQKDKSPRAIIITHNYGFDNSGEQQFDPGIRSDLLGLGITIHTGTMVLRNHGTALRNAFGFSHEELINKTLRMLGQGVKVGVELAAIACDAGLVPPGDVITVAGTASGADTAMIVAAESSNRFFDIRVREILVKPR